MKYLNEYTHREIIVATCCLALLFLLLNPFEWYMLSMYSMLLLSVSVALGLGYALLMWCEGESSDEREVMHQARVGRVTHLSASVFLVGAIVYQALNHQLDMALVVLLAVMVIAKIAAGVYARVHY